MRAIRIHEHGGPEALRVEEMAVPAPGRGEVLVKVAAAGVNFIDTYQRSGLYKVPLPLTLGLEGAGTVDRAGPDAALFKPGDRVAWSSAPGSYAAFVAAPEHRLVPLPPDLDFDRGAAAMLQGLTAHYLATTTFALREGHTCLVHAAAGGVGLLLVQIAKLRGARVIGTAGDPAKAALARDAGADEVIRYRDQDFLAETRRLTGGRGVDVVYDGVGRDTFDRSLECVAPFGTLVMFGNASGPVPPFDILRLQAGPRFLARPRLAEHIANREDLLGRAAEVLGWVQAGRLTLRIHDRYPLEDAERAHRDLEARRTTGKLLLVP